MENIVRRIEPPDESWADMADQAATRAIDAMTLGFGSLVLDKFVPSRLDSRMIEFYRDVADGINTLADQGRIDRAKIESHEQFISNYVEAVLVAIRTHEKEKREALRNAVLNTALGSAPDDTRQQIFMRWIAELTPLHINVLEYIRQAPSLGGTLENEIVTKFPETKAVHLAAVIIKDLAARNLIEDERPGTVTLQRSPGAARVTTLGSAFLSFIRKPEAIK